MTSKRVLLIGNCILDQSELNRSIRGQFDAEVVAAPRWEEAREILREGRFDLILVNRRLHGENREGVEVISEIKSDPALAELPVMLLSNFAEYQQAAVSAGAEPGSGKAQLDHLETRRKLGRFLA